MAERKGSISVQTADIFPIIKKWLYSEHDIFLRELVSNATDAITKRATFARTHNVEIPSGEIKVTLHKSKNIVQISDNGLGMTEEEIEKYLAQLAFSGAEEFVSKMKESGEEKNDIIGKFGLGFYSAFMVADKVEVESLSWQDGSSAVKWTCEGETDYQIGPSERKDVGTTISLHINDESKEFLGEFKLLETLRKFCDFLPYPIEVIDEEKELKEENDVKVWKVNETEPLWKKDPKEVKDEEYKEFYRKLFPMDAEPLFWLHLKVDHPFTLEGILYFPKINPKMAINEQNIKLYSKQVFVSDNVKNVIPDFLGLLKGVIDSTDIPLNVSRSSLQGDPNVRRISNYVVKKVAESLKKLFNNEREKYESIWKDIGLFAKYGCMSDPKFDELMRERVIYSSHKEKWLTLGEYSEAIPSAYQEKLKGKILYFEKDKFDPALVGQLKEEGIAAVEIDDQIDTHFMQHVEMKMIGDNTLKFVSVDSEISSILEGEKTTEDDIKVRELFQKHLTPEKKDDKEDPASLDVEIQNLKNATSPAYIKVDEQMKRFSKMTESMGQPASFPVKRTLVINTKNPIVQNALKIHEKGGNEKLVGKLCLHVEDLANISSEGLKIDEREAFLVRTQDLMKELTEHFV